MQFDPLGFLTKPRRFMSAAIVPVLAAYLALTLALYFEAVIPSYANGTTSWTFAVDSTVYTDLADALREGRDDPIALNSMARFPNNLWAPVFISLLLNSSFYLMLLNYCIFTASLLLFKKTYHISLSVMILLLLLNPTTTTSILCVNKEVLDVFVLSLFLFAEKRRNRALIFVALVIALLNRYEICAVIIAYMIVKSRLNPWREHRWTTVLLLVGALNFLMPVWGGQELERRFAEAESAGFVRLLDNLQMHYLFVLAVLPKIAESLFGQLVNPLVWEDPSSWLFINFFSNLACAFVILMVVKKRQWALRNDLLYLGAIGSVMVAQALVVQPRYFYFLYALLCLQVARKGTLRTPASCAPDTSLRKVEHA
jgi:hypothetical protein